MTSFTSEWLCLSSLTACALSQNSNVFLAQRLLRVRAFLRDVSRPQYRKRIAGGPLPPPRGPCQLCRSHSCLAPAASPDRRRVIPGPQTGRQFCRNSLSVLRRTGSRSPHSGPNLHSQEPGNSCSEKEKTSPYFLGKLFHHHAFFFFFCIVNFLSILANN